MRRLSQRKSNVLLSETSVFRLALVNHFLCDKALISLSLSLFLSECVCVAREI